MDKKIIKGPKGSLGQEDKLDDSKLSESDRMVGAEGLETMWLMSRPSNFRPLVFFTNLLKMESCFQFEDSIHSIVLGLQKLTVPQLLL